jgi:hypothetical protein
MKYLAIILCSIVLTLVQVPLSIASGTSFDSGIKVSYPAIYFDDELPARNATLEAGQTFLVRTVINTTSVPYGVGYTQILEFRNEIGQTIFMWTGSESVPPQGSPGSILYVPWTPEEPGLYQLRTFLITDLVDPEVLTPVMSTEVVINRRIGTWFEQSIACVGGRCDVTLITRPQAVNDTERRFVGQQFGGYKEPIDFIRNYYGMQNITILDLRLVPLEMSNCEWGECTDILLLELAVPDSDIDIMINYGYGISSIPHNNG